MSKFDQIVPKFMRRLMDEVDLGFSVEDAAAIFGNAGHESGGLEKLQEINPTVKGSAGGYGWFQWTGPRRRAYAAWCVQNRKRPDDDEANYGFLLHELRTTEKGAVAKVKGAMGLEAKVQAFELAFERAGVKHYPSRTTWARKAMQAYNAMYPAPAVVAAMDEHDDVIEQLLAQPPSLLIPQDIPTKAPSLAQTAAAIAAGEGGVLAPVNKAIAAGKGAAQSVAATATTVTGTAAAISGYTGIFNGISPTWLLLGFGGVLLVVMLGFVSWWAFRKTFKAPPNVTGVGA